MIAMQEVEVTDLGGYLRDATMADMDLLFEWANELSVRKNSFSTEEITYEEHQRWYSELLERKDSRQYIYVFDGEDVGQARITIHGEEAEIGYSICAERRGMGHGKNLLQLLYNQVRKDFPEVEKLVAKVKPGNIASQRAFLDVGYVKKYEAFEICLEEEREMSGWIRER